MLGALLFFTRVVDAKILVALSEFASEQEKPTENTMLKIKQFLDYEASQGETVLTYHASNMILAVHSDASYNSKIKVRRRSGGKL